MQEALQTNFVFGSDDGDHTSNDYTGPPLIPEDELEHSSEDEFDGPYAMADQVAQREKRLQHQKVNDGFKQSSFDTESNKSSHSGTYVSSDSIRAKKRQDRSMSLNRSVINNNDGDDDDTGFSPLPAGTVKLNNYSEKSLINSDVSSND